MSPENQMPNMPPAVPPQVPLQPFTPPPVKKNRTGLIVGIVLGGIVLIAAIVLAVVLISRNRTTSDDLSSTLSSSSSTSTSGAQKYDSIENINKTIAGKKYFSMNFPGLSCGPADSLYISNKQEWSKGWVACLGSSWKPEIETAMTGSTYVQPEVKFVSSKAEVTACDVEGSSDQAVAMYCRKDGVIYILTQKMSNLEYDLSTIFHEFTHDLQASTWVSIDAQSLVGMLYIDNPNQAQSKDDALAAQQSRIEINAECSTLAMMSTSGRLATVSGKKWLEDDFKNPTELKVSSGYGSKALRSRLATEITGAKSPSMSSCNTWKLQGDEL